MDGPAGLDAVLRPLTAAEQQRIRARISSLQPTGGRAAPVSVAVAGALIAVLWIWTLLTSDAPRPVITAFWLIIGGGIVFWVRRDMDTYSAQLRSMAAELESALRRNTAEVYEIRAGAFAELEEIEDEGACYAFELDGERLAFICGQEFYPSSGFPSLDFSLVNILDERNRVVDMLIDERGPKAVPARTISAAVKRRLAVPEHLAVLRGTLDDLETRIGSAVD